jgi:hypothetical protein
VYLAGREEVEKDVQEYSNTDPPEARINVICYQGDPGCEEDAVETATMRKHTPRVYIRQVATYKY